VVNKDSVKYTLTISFLLCIVCSIVVAGSAVMLKPAQQANKARDFKGNILSSAGLLEEGKSVEEIFERVETRIVDLQTGKFTDAVEVENYDQRKASKDPKMSEKVDPAIDIVKIGRKERYSAVYLATIMKGTKF
jgi:Na+-transporting NADH:ubiquinone oxidoreductase subunit C